SSSSRLRPCWCSAWSSPFSPGYLVSESRSALTWCTVGIQCCSTRIRIMASNAPFEAEEFRSAVSATIHRHWGLFLLEGIVLIVLGSLAILVPAVASLAATIFFGWILLVSGLVGLFATFRARHAPGFGWSLFSAITGIVAGIVLLSMPVQGTLSLTAVLIAFL